MNTIIYYFTGTGNTLAIARDLASELGDTELVPVPIMIQQDTIVGDGDAVGIAFPVYFWNLPVIVRKFTENLHITGAPYTIQSGPDPQKERIASLSGFCVHHAGELYRPG
jgi:hypothetical protein